MTWYDFQQKYNFTPPFTTFQGIKLAVLSTWPELRNIDGVTPRLCKPYFIDFILKSKNMTNWTFQDKIAKFYATLQDIGNINRDFY